VETRTGFDEEARRWSHGNLGVAPAPATEKDTTPSTLLTYTPWKDRLKVRYQSLAEDSDSDVVLPRKQGILLHDVLSRMEEPDQLETVMMEMKREGWLDDHQAGKVQHIIEKVLKMEVLQPWYQKQHQRLAERSIIGMDRKLKRPDLILYNQNECLVYDFKFTAGDDDKQRHEKQIREYMEMLASMGFAAVQGWVIYGLENKALRID
jgi:hypothetical protein